MAKNPASLVHARMLSSVPPMFLQDKSWRVRYNVAQQLVLLAEALGPEVTR